MRAVDLETGIRTGSYPIRLGKSPRTLIPSKASRKRDCCCVSASVSDLRPLKMMGSKTRIPLVELHILVNSAIHTVCDNDTILALNSFIRHGLGQVDGQEDGVHLPSNWVEWSFQQHWPSFSRCTGSL